MRSPRVLLVLAAVALVAVAVPLLARRGSPGEGRVGLSSHLAYAPEPLEPQLAQMHAAGVRWLREDFLWDTLEPARGRFDWRASDRLMTAAARTGMDVLGVLAYSARWALPSGEGDLRHPPADPRDYAAFARAVADRYGQGGAFWRSHPELPARPLRAVEVWNEPWGHFLWKPDPDPAAYARLVRAAGTAVHAAGREVKVLAFGDVLQVRSDGSTPDWFSAVLDADPKLADVVDGWSVHPYTTPRSRPPGEGRDACCSFSRVALTHDIAVRRGADRPVWITEIGWSTARTSWGVSEGRQAADIGAALDLALGSWRSFVPVTFVYGWDRDNGAPDDLEGHFGLRRADGSLKPAWRALGERAQ